MNGLSIQLFKWSSRKCHTGITSHGSLSKIIHPGSKKAIAEISTNHKGRHNRQTEGKNDHNNYLRPASQEANPNKVYRTQDLRNTGSALEKGRNEPGHASSEVSRRRLNSWARILVNV